MKLLFDQNLSYKLLSSIEEIYPGSKHVKDFDLTEADDDIIWNFAKEQGYVIITKDTDFINRSLLHGHPPKIIQLMIGNCSTDFIKDKLLKEKDIINKFLNSKEESLLIIE